MNVKSCSNFTPPDNRNVPGELTDLTDGAVVGRLIPGPRPQHRLLAGRRQGFLHPLALLQGPQQAVPVTGTRRVRLKNPGV